MYDPIIPKIAVNDFSELKNSDYVVLATPTQFIRPLLADKQDIFENKIQYNSWCNNLKVIAKEYNWENESKKLIEIYNKIE